MFENISCIYIDIFTLITIIKLKQLQDEVVFVHAIVICRVVAVIFCRAVVVCGATVVCHAVDCHVVLFCCSVPCCPVRSRGCCSVVAVSLVGCCFPVSKFLVVLLLPGRFRFPLYKIKKKDPRINTLFVLFANAVVVSGAVVVLFLVP